MAKSPRPRITLRDLESVEIPTATLEDAPTEAASGDERAPVSSSVDTLSVLPAGISADTAQLLAMPEPAPAPEPPAATVESEPTPVAAPVPPPPSRAWVGALAAVTLAAVVGVVWWTQQAPELDESLFPSAAPTTVSALFVEAEQGFTPLPDPVVDESSTAAEPAGDRATTTRRSTPSGARSTTRRVRGEDLF